MIWSFHAPGETWALNITPDGRLAVGAFGDGSIRWYRMTDGTELLAMFRTGTSRAGSPGHPPATTSRRRAAIHWSAGT